VHSPKTERKGKAKRIVPIFEKLHSYLVDAFEQSPEGEDRIFPNIHEKKSMGSWIAKLTNRAVVALWEKPFQNMRASCATDLIEIFPSHVCEAWLGHTGKVADRHYR
jgi:integrase